MKYMRLIVGIAVLCVLATIVSNFVSSAFRDSNPGLAYNLLSYVNTLDGIGMVAIVLLVVFGRAESPSRADRGSEEDTEQGTDDETGEDEDSGHDTGAGST